MKFFPVIYFTQLVLFQSTTMNTHNTYNAPLPEKKNVNRFRGLLSQKWYCVCAMQIKYIVESKLPITSILNICIDVQTAYYLWVFLLYFLSRHPVIEISRRLESKHQLKQLPWKDLPMLLFPKTRLMYISVHIQKLSFMCTV